MPRLTVWEFIKRHDWLRVLWLDDISQLLFAQLPAHQQWELHDFYRPADALTEDELAEHFKAVKGQHPHLAVLAGHHYGAIRNAYASHHAELTDLPKRGRKGEAAVSFVARAHVDVERLTAALKLIDNSVDNNSLK